MRIGLISDLHADPLALERALEVLERAGVDRVVCMGDCVEKGPDGDRVVDLLAAHDVATVRGNHDDNAVRDAREYGCGELSRASVAWLDALPPVRRARWAGTRVVMAHGMPGSIDTYVFPGQIPKRLKRVARSLDADVLLLGHTHQPMCVRLGPLLVVNPGAVACGRPRDSHTCALLELPACTVTLFDLRDGSTRALAEASMR